MATIRLIFFSPSYFGLLFAGHLRMAVKVRGGVMSTVVRVIDHSALPDRSGANAKTRGERPSKGGVAAISASGIRFGA